MHAQTINNLMAVMAQVPGAPGAHIGRFGMSDVYRVQGADGWRAVKLSLEDDPCAEEALTNEARAYETLGPHPNIAAYHGRGRVDGRPCIELEYLDDAHFGGARRCAPTDEGELVRVARDIAAGLAHIHEAGHVHRDIKPASLWLGGTSKLFDLGLTERVGRSLARRRFAPGTPAYASIDRLAGRPVSFSDDIFALGLTLYAYRTGEEPFAFTTECIANRLDGVSVASFMKRWMKTYKGLAANIENFDCSRTFKALLKGLIYCLEGAHVFPDASAVVEFLSLRFPEREQLSFWEG